MVRIDNDVYDIISDFLPSQKSFRKEKYTQFEHKYYEQLYQEHEIEDMFKYLWDVFYYPTYTQGNYKTLVKFAVIFQKIFSYDTYLREKIIDRHITTEHCWNVIDSTEDKNTMILFFAMLGSDELQLDLYYNYEKLKSCDDEQPDTLLDIIPYFHYNNVLSDDDYKDVCDFLKKRDLTQQLEKLYRQIVNIDYFTP